MGKGLSITAFVLSFFIPVVGLILGIIALSKAKDNPEAGKGFAIAAIVIGSLWILMILVLIILGAGFYLIGSPTKMVGTNQLGNVAQDLVQNTCQIAPPFSCGDDFIIDENEIRFSIVNTDTKPVAINSISIEGCPEFTNPISISPGESAGIGTSCEEITLEEGINHKTIEITYSYDGSGLELKTYGQFFFSAFANP